MRYAKALGLSLLAALSLMAFTSAVASAGGVGGDVKQAGKLLTAQKSVNAELAEPATSSLLVPNLSFAIRCHAATLNEGTVNPLVGGVTTGSGTVAFTGCLAFEHPTLVALTKCIIEGSPEAAEREIVAKAKIQIVRTAANGTAYVLVAPKEEGGVFTKITFGPLCGALAEETIEVKGSLIGQALGLEAVKLGVVEAAKSVQELFGTKIVHKDGTKLLIPDSLVFGTNHALLDGEIKLFYNDKDAGSTLGVEAGS